MFLCKKKKKNCDQKLINFLSSNKVNISSNSVLHKINLQYSVKKSFFNMFNASKDTLMAF